MAEEGTSNEEEDRSATSEEAKTTIKARLHKHTASDGNSIQATTKPTPAIRCQDQCR